jgi:hypothetical protein
MTAETHKTLAQHEAANLLAENDVQFPIMTRELAIALLATAWLAGYGAGAQRISAITMDALRESGLTP